MRFVIESHEPLTQNVYHMRLSGDTRAIVRAGQFVQVQLPGFYLRRPISVCDWRPGEEGTLDLIYKVVGLGTEAMSRYAVGTELDLLTGLGNGFDVDRLDEVTASQFPLLVGGGVGTPPMYGLCKKLLAACKKPRVILGFNTAAEVFWQKEFEALGVPVTVTTADGTQGRARLCDRRHGAAGGKVRLRLRLRAGTDAARRARAVRKAGHPRAVQLEERMACGFGVCMGCSCKTKYGSKRICKDGPVLRREEILW